MTHRLTIIRFFASLRYASGPYLTWSDDLLFHTSTSLQPATTVPNSSRYRDYLPPLFILFHISTIAAVSADAAATAKAFTATATDTFLSCWQLCRPLLFWKKFFLWFTTSRLTTTHHSVRTCIYRNSSIMLKRWRNLKALRLKKN